GGGDGGGGGAGGGGRGGGGGGAGGGGRATADRRGGGRRGGGHRPRRDRVPHRVGGQHRAPVGRRLGALRHDVLRPAGHGARGYPNRGHRPADHPCHGPRRGAPRARARPPGHAPGPTDARGP